MAAFRLSTNHGLVKTVCQGSRCIDQPHPVPLQFIASTPTNRGDCGVQSVYFVLLRTWKHSPGKYIKGFRIAVEQSIKFKDSSALFEWCDVLQ